MQNWTLFRSVLQAEESLVSNDVVGVAAKLDLHPVRGHWRIDMRAAAGQDDPLIESGRIGTQVPFADERLLIACLLQQMHEGDLFRPQAALVAIDLSRSVRQ